MPKKLEVSDVLEDLPTLSEAMVKFAESLEPLPLDELVQVVEDRNAQDILIAAANFKAAMRQVLERRVGLH
jgi:hypothetical protein